MRILVTDGTSKKSLSVVRSLGDAASFVGVTSKYPLSTAGVSRHADAQYWIRDRDPESYVRKINEITEEADIDQLLPVRGRRWEIASEYRDELRLPVEKILPSREAMNVAIRKRETYELAEAVGIPTPTTRTISALEDLRSVGDEIGYPAVMKTGKETEARFVEVVESNDELEAAYSAYRETNDSDPLVQEYLPGTSRGFFALYVEGELVDGYSHRRIREYPAEGGASACAASIRDDRLEEYADELLSALDWHGVAMVEFKDSAEGVPKVVEINPKFWGSLDLAIESGLNFPRALVEYTAGRREFDFEFTPRQVHWPLTGDMQHLSGRPRSAPAVVRDLLSPHVRSNFRRSDPAPHVIEFMAIFVRPIV